MATANNHIRRGKQWPALLAALAMTLFLGLAIAALGINALFNQDVAPALAAGPNDAAGDTDRATIENLQSLVAEYQAREQQYQQELQDAATQLNTANTQLQQYENLIGALQSAGVIQIAPDGRVFLGGGFSGGHESDGGGD